MAELDMNQLRSWIGRSEQATDILSHGLVERFAATLGPDAADLPGEAPLAIHWCLAPAAVPEAETGPDGHPARGGFLPPVPLQHRMWAGGEIEFLAPLLAGDTVTRTSTIADIVHKQGRTGDLVFVSVNHHIASPRGLAVRERQEIVYRDGGLRSTPAPSEPRPAEVTAHVEATSLLLFRYSAMTFNGHRIHYDRTYARDVEHYDGLVVHGPLQATLMAHMAARRFGKAPARFTYRGVMPLTDGGTFSVNAAATSDGLDLWCANASGQPTMMATASA